MRSDVFDRFLDGRNLVSLGIGNLNGKFILNGHDNLDNIQRVQTQIISEFDCWVDLVGIDLIEILDDIDDTLCHVSGIQKSLKAKIRARKNVRDRRANE
jgi:hypothetical protein